MTYFFIHTFKTSGTTFMDVLKRNTSIKTGFFYPLRREMDDFESRVKEAPRYHLEQNPDWKKLNYIGGHFTFGIHNIFKGDDFKYIGVIRDPVDHYISLYKAFLRMPEDYKDTIIPDKEKAINEMLNLEYSHNMQTWFLSGLSLEEIKNDKEKAYITVIENYEKYFAGIYPTERFDEGLLYFKHMIGLKPQYYLKKNVATNKMSAIVNPELVEKIKKVNDVDMRLFQYFSDKFEQDLKKIKGINREVKTFKMLNQIYGWFSRHEGINKAK